MFETGGTIIAAMTRRRALRKAAIRKSHVQGWTWYLLSDIFPGEGLSLLSVELDNPSRSDLLNPVHRKGQKATFRAALSNHDCFLKLYQPRKLTDKFSAGLGWKRKSVVTEAYYTSIAPIRGIKQAQLYSFGEKYTAGILEAQIIVTEYLTNYIPLREFVRACSHQKILTLALTTASQLSNQDVLYMDFHTDNIFVDETGDHCGLVDFEFCENLRGARNELFSFYAGHLYWRIQQKQVMPISEAEYDTLVDQFVAQSPGLSLNSNVYTFFKREYLGMRKRYAFIRGAVTN